MHTDTPVLAPAMLDAPSGPNLDFLCVQQSGASPFRENYAKLYFHAKHFWFTFFQIKCQIWPILHAAPIF